MAHMLAGGLAGEGRYREGGFLMFGQSLAVKYGDRGRRVKQIQHLLAKLGYEVGAVDGIFGLVTEEAVQAFQRDFQLTPDGIVGPKTARLLSVQLESGFLLHRTGPGEDLRTIAQQYALSPRVLAQINKLSTSRVVPGQVLRIPKRLVIGFCSATAQPAESLFRHAGRLNAVVAPGLAFSAQEGLSGALELRADLQNWIKQHHIELWLALAVPQDLAELENLLLVRKNMNQAVRAAVKTVRSAGAEGVVLLLPSTVLPRHRLNLSRLCKQLNTQLPEVKLTAAVPLPTEPGAATIAYQYLLKWCRWLLLYPEPTTAHLGQAVRRVLREVGCWQLLLGLHPAPKTRVNQERLALLTKYNLAGAVILGFGREGESFWASLCEEFLSGDINLRSDS